MGDFNVDLLNDTTKSMSLVETTKSLQLTQLITEPTLIMPLMDTSSTLLDHVYCTSPQKISSVQVLDPDLSDHQVEFIAFRNTCRSNHELGNPRKTIEYRATKTFSDSSFLLDVCNAQWNTVLTISDRNNALDLWYNMFSMILNKHAPLKRKRVKHLKMPEWLTPDILEAKRHRDMLHKKGKTAEYTCM